MSRQTSLAVQVALFVVSRISLFILPNLIVSNDV